MATLKPQKSASSKSNNSLGQLNRARAAAKVVAAFAITPVALCTAQMVQSQTLPAQAQAAAQAIPPTASGTTQEFRVPAGPLGAALANLAQSAGQTINVPPELVTGKNTVGLTGRYTLNEALARLLAGSGLEAVNAGGSLMLRRLAVQANEAGTLGAITVTATSDVARAGLFGNKKVQEIPFSVTGYNESLIRDQQARQLRDVVLNDASVRSTNTVNSESEAFQIRGLALLTNEVTFDGLYGLQPVRRNGVGYAERVEVFKGPNALINGLSPFGSVGGSVNVVPKRAGTDAITDLTLDYGSKSSMGVQVDISRRFGTDDAFGIRLNATKRSGETPIRDSKNSFTAADVALDYRNGKFRATADIGYQQDDYDANQQNLGIAAGVVVPVAPDGTLNLSQLWGKSKTDSLRYLVGASYDLTDSWTVSGRYGELTHNEDFKTPTALTIVNTNGNYTYRYIAQPARFKTKTSELGLKGRFTTGAVKHELAVNSTQYHADNKFAFSTFGPVLTSNLYQPVYTAIPSFAAAPTTPMPGNERTLKTLAVADTLTMFDDSLQVTFGLRHQVIQITNYINTSNNATGVVSGKIDQSKTSPALAALYKINPSWAVYANATEALASGPQAPGGTANAGTVLSPIVARSYEAGTKLDYGRWGAGAAVFKTTQQVGITDPATNIFAANGQNSVSGLEVSVFGSPARSLRLTGGLTLLNAVQAKTAGGVTDGKKAVSVPDTQVSLFADWATPFARGLSLNSRLLYTGKQFVDAVNTQSIPSWTRLDLGAMYVLSGTTPITLRATVENVANARYWAAASSSRLSRGGPRAVFVSAELNF